MQMLVVSAIMKHAHHQRKKKEMGEKVLVFINTTSTIQNYIKNNF
jgi:hypothetical protein